MTEFSLPAPGTLGRWVMGGEGIGDLEPLAVDYAADLLTHLDAVSGLPGFDLVEVSGYGGIAFDVSYVCEGCWTCEEADEDYHVVYSSVEWAVA